MTRSKESATDGAERGQTQFVMELPSDPRVIEAAVTYLADRCRAFDFSGSRLSLNFCVGVTEALANAVVYGNDADPEKTVRVEVSLDDTRVTLRVEDQGLGFDPDDVPDPTLPANLEEAGGRGLFLIRNLMDEVEYNDRGNSVRMVLLREPPVARSGPARP